MKENTMNTQDEFPHPIGDDPAWSESYYFNFVDPKSKIAMFTRMGFRANDGWADGLHVVYLGGDRVAFTYGRRTIEKDDQELSVGGLTLHRGEPFKNWRIEYDGPAQDIADASIMITPSKERPEGWFTPATLKMEIDFESLIDPHYANQGAHGHFEQTGKASGTITIGDETFEVSGYGVRDKSWGPRSWRPRASGESKGSAKPAGPRPFVNWFSMTFGDEAAIGCSCFDTGNGMRGEGWILKDGEVMDLKDIEITSTYKPDSILHDTLRFTGKAADGTDIVIDGKVLTICPTKVPAPGGATFINEGLATFKMCDLEGDGIAEYWHMIKR